MECARIVISLDVNHARQEIRTSVKNVNMVLWRQKEEFANVKKKGRKSTLKENVNPATLEDANHVQWEKKTTV